PPPALPSFPTRRSSDLCAARDVERIAVLVRDNGDVLRADRPCRSSGRLVHAVLELREPSVCAEPADAEIAATVRGKLEHITVVPDRKSTRLNSSHVAIS